MDLNKFIIVNPNGTFYRDGTPSWTPELDDAKKFTYPKQAHQYAKSFGLSRNVVVTVRQAMENDTMIQQILGSYDINRQLLD